VRVIGVLPVTVRAEGEGYEVPDVVLLPVVVGHPAGAGLALPLVPDLVFIPHVLHAGDVVAEAMALTIAPPHVAYHELL